MPVVSWGRRMVLPGHGIVTDRCCVKKILRGLVEMDLVCQRWGIWSGYLLGDSRRRLCTRRRRRCGADLKWRELVVVERVVRFGGAEPIVQRCAVGGCRQVVEFLQISRPLVQVFVPVHLCEDVVNDVVLCRYFE